MNATQARGTAGCRKCPVTRPKNRNQTSIHKAAHGRTSSLTGPSVNPPCPTPQPPRPRIRPRRRSTLNNFSSLLHRSHSCKTLNFMRSYTKILSLQSQIPLGSVCPLLSYFHALLTLLPHSAQLSYPFVLKKSSAKAPAVRRACTSCHSGKTRCSEILPCQVGTYLYPLFQVCQSRHPITFRAASSVVLVPPVLIRIQRLRLITHSSKPLVRLH